MNGQQLYRHWLGKDASKDGEAFHKWMNESPSHEWEYLYLQHLWENGPYLPESTLKELDIQDFKEIQVRIDKVRRQTRLFKVIFGLSILVIFALAGVFFIGDSESKVYWEVRNESLFRTCQKLDQEFGLHIQVAQPIQNCRISGTFLADRPDSVLYRMARNFHLQCHKQGNSFFIDGRTCQN